MVTFPRNNLQTEMYLLVGKHIIQENEYNRTDLRAKREKLCINTAMRQAGVPTLNQPEYHHADNPKFFMPDIKRGELPEPFWFLRQSLILITRGKFEILGQYNDIPTTTVSDILFLIDTAVDLVTIEREQDEGLILRNIA